jgi:hypothetical protein
MNIFELNKQALTEIKQISANIIDNINNKIAERFAANAVNNFDFDVNYLLDGQPDMVIGRVIDYIGQYFRSRGIRIATKSSYFYNYPYGVLLSDPMAPVPVLNTVTDTFNGQFDLGFSNAFFISEDITWTQNVNQNTILNIGWHVRDDREFMKHYV